MVTVVLIFLILMLAVLCSIIPVQYSLGTDREGNKVAL